MCVKCTCVSECEHILACFVVLLLLVLRFFEALYIYDISRVDHW